MKAILPGSKLIVRGREMIGFADVAGLDADGIRVEVKYYTSPVSSRSAKVVGSSIIRAILPAQTRCFQRTDGLTRYGRVLVPQSETSTLRNYLVQFAGEP